MRREDFEQLYDGANGLAERLYKAVRKAGTLDELYFLTKTKRYTLARIRRAVLCGYLGLSKGQLLIPNAYVRVLGMNSKGKEILSTAKCALPLDTSLKALSKTSRAAHRQAAFEERRSLLSGIREACALRERAYRKSCDNVDYNLMDGKSLRGGDRLLIQKSAAPFEPKGHIPMKYQFCASRR